MMSCKVRWRKEVRLRNWDIRNQERKRNTGENWNIRVVVWSLKKKGRPLQT